MSAARERGWNEEDFVPWSEEVEPLHAGLLNYDTSTHRHDPVSDDFPT